MSAVVRITHNAPACPCCGAAVSPLDLIIDEPSGVIVYGGDTARLTGQQMLIFKALSNAYPRSLAKADLYAAIPHLDHKEGDRESKLVEVQIHHMRKKLDPMGLAIVTQWGVGYSLELSEEGKAAFLRDRRFNETRTTRSSVGSGDIATVRMLRNQGFALTAIARRAGLTYRAVMKAIDVIDANASARKSMKGAGA